MKKYRVNKHTYTNPKGNNEVHSDVCKHYHELVLFEDLGYHSTCYGAVADAKAKGYTKADGCVVCSNACHTG